MQGYQGQAMVSRKALAKVLRVPESKLGGIRVHIVYGYMHTTNMFYVRVVAQPSIECMYVYKPHFFEDMDYLNVLDAGLVPYK
jgi:hypothetical protein